MLAILYFCKNAVYSTWAIGLMCNLPAHLPCCRWKLINFQVTGLSLTKYELFWFVTMCWQPRPINSQLSLFLLPAGWPFCLEWPKLSSWPEFVGAVQLLLKKQHLKYGEQRLLCWGLCSNHFEEFVHAGSASIKDINITL